MQVSHHGHVLDLVEFRRVHGEHLVTVQSEYLGIERRAHDECGADDLYLTVQVWSKQGEIV